MEQKQIAGLLGAALLYVGIFSPIFGSAIKGSVDYFQFSRLEGTLMLVCASLAMTLSMARRYDVLWLTGVGAFGTMGFTFVKFMMIASGSGTRFAQGFFDSPFAGVNRMVQQTFALEWGWGPLITGAVLVVMANRLKGAGQQDP